MNDQKMDRDSCSDRKRKRHDKTETEDEANEETTNVSPLRASVPRSSIPPGEWYDDILCISEVSNFHAEPLRFVRVEGAAGAQSYESLADLPPVPLQRYPMILENTSTVRNLLTADGELVSCFSIFITTRYSKSILSAFLLSLP